MTDDSPNGSSTEIIEADDWLYRRLALNHLRSDGTVNRTAFMRNSVPPNKGKEPDPEVSVDSLIQGNASDRAMELCELMAEEMSKHVETYPVGSPWRRTSDSPEQP